MSEDELKDWEIVEQQDAVVDKPPGDILNMDVSKAERLNGFLKNQYWQDSCSSEYNFIN